MDPALKSELEQRVCRVLKIPPAPISDAQVLAQLKGWDSIRFVRFMMDMEKDWGLRFEAHEVARLQTWGELLNLVKSKKASAV